MAGDASFQVIDGPAIHRLHDTDRQLGLDVLVGLSAEWRSPPCNYFYDDAVRRYSGGSCGFQPIT